MYAFWTVWALIVGAIATVSTDDWSKVVTGAFIRRLLAFIFVGLGIPVMASVAWPSVDDEMWLPRLILDVYACTAAFGVGLVITPFMRSLVNNRKLMCTIGQHRECVVEEFPSDVTTILGVECIDCHRPRRTINSMVPRYPSDGYGRSVEEAEKWLESKLGGKVGGASVQFR